MRLAGTSSVTRGPKVRSEAGTRTSSFRPTSMGPAIDVTVEFQRGKSAAFVRRLQIFSGVARTRIETRHSRRKVDVRFWRIGSVIMSRRRSSPARGCGGGGDFFQGRTPPPVSSRANRWAGYADRNACNRVRLLGHLQLREVPGARHSPAQMPPEHRTSSRSERASPGPAPFAYSRDVKLHWMLPAVAALATLLVACGAAPPAAPTEARPAHLSSGSPLKKYFPLEDGRVYAYATTENADTGLFVARVHRTDATHGELRSSSGAKRLVYRPDSLVYETGVVLLSAPIQVGTSWSGEHGGTTRITSTTKSVEVPAGRYSGCVEAVEEGGMPPKSRYATTYCPDVGIVSLDVVAPRGEASAVLKSYGIRRHPVRKRASAAPGAVEERSALRRRAMSASWGAFARGLARPRPGSGLRPGQRNLQWRGRRRAATPSQTRPRPQLLTPEASRDTCGNSRAPRDRPSFCIRLRWLQLECGTRSANAALLRRGGGRAPLPWAVRVQLRGGRYSTHARIRRRVRACGRRAGRHEVLLLLRLP